MNRFPTLQLAALAAGCFAWSQPAHALTPSEIYERSRSAVVKIRVRCFGEGGSGSGSGFVVTEKGGSALIVTNYHVAYPCKEASQTRLEVAFDDRITLPATSVGGDRLTDVALVSVPRKNVQPLQFAGTTLGQPGRNQPIRPGVADEVAVGADIVAIGFPLNLDRQPTVTRGIISAVGRNDGDMSELLQFDATIDHGSSGGPLLNMNGQVVGIVFGGPRTNKNLVYAVPYTIAKVVVGDLMTTGQVRRNGFGLLTGISILEELQARFRQDGVPIREGLLLLQHEVAIARPRVQEHWKKLQNELARCDLIQQISWVRPEEELAAACGSSKTCRVARADRSIDIRSAGDWHNAMLWTPAGARAKISYVRYPQSKCDVISSVRPNLEKSPTLAQTAKLNELMQSEGTPGSVAVILGPRSRYVLGVPEK